MTIKKIAYSKTYPILNIGVWEKILLEAELMPDEDTRKCLYELKRQVESFHYESNKADEKKVEEAKKPVWKEIQELNTLEEQIKSCSELKVLEGYKLIVKGKPELETIYNNRLKELT